MNALNYYLYEKSLSFNSNESVEDLDNCIVRFNEILERIEHEHKILLSPDTIFSSMIEKETSFFDWIFKGDGIEKQLLRTIVEQLPTIDYLDYKNQINSLNDPSNCSNDVLVCFYKCDEVFKSDFDLNYSREEIQNNSRRMFRENLFNLCIRNSNDILNANKFYLTCAKSISKFLDEAKYCFENLHFGLSVEENMRAVYTENQFKEIHIAKIIFHLKILDEYGLDIINEFRNRGEAIICDRIKIKGNLEGVFDDCSPEGDSSRASRLSLNFKDNTDDLITIRCSPHTKYFSAGNHYRIYFGLPNDSIANGKKIPIGSIGRHL